MAQVRTSAPVLSGKLAKVFGCGAHAEEKTSNYCEGALKEIYENLFAKQNGFGLVQFKQLVTIFDEQLDGDILLEAFQILSGVSIQHVATANITLPQLENWYYREAESSVHISDEEVKRDCTRQKKISELFQKKNIFSALRLWKEIHQDYEEEFKEDLHPTVKTVAKRKLAIIHAKMHIPACVARAMEQLHQGSDGASKRTATTYF
jgi:hypothetical protein